MSSFSRVPLGTVCSFQNGGTPDKSVDRYFHGDVPWITGADITSTVVTSARSFITEEAVERSATKQVPAGTVLLVTRTSVGKVAVAGIDLCFSQDITALTPDDSLLHPSYLVAFLRTQESFFERQARGATIKGITRHIVADLSIPLPPLPEQRRVAAVLDRAEALRLKRRASLAHLDILTQALFLDLFGDPVTNPRRWPNPTLGGLPTFQQYGPRFYNESYSLDGIRIARITDLDEAGTLNYSEMPKLVVSDEDREKYALHPGDLIFARTGATVGKVALIQPDDPPCIAGAYFIVMRFADTIDPIYAKAVLIAPSIRSCHDRAKRRNKTSADQDSGSCRCHSPRWNCSATSLVVSPPWRG